MIRAIVFDMDGVLVDARQWHFEALNRALQLFGHDISVDEHESIYDGLPTRIKLEMLVERNKLPRRLCQFINELKQRYTLEIVRQRCRPNFVHEFALSRLKADGYRLALASNSIRETVDVMMANTCLNGYLEFSLSNEDVKVAKPSPEIYLRAAELLGLAPGQCLVVEDNHNGIQSALAAGAALLQVGSVDDVTYERITQRIAEIEGGAA
jgi:beta-phosphoglucomutase-like phosphatase (HAD superfamily)